MTQYGFFFDQSRCYDCKACAVACKQWNDLEPGPVKWLRMFSWEEGPFPEARLKVLFAPCYHCENPVCVDACPNQALFKEDKYGAVLVDPDRCRGARQCWIACPYGAVVYEDDTPGTPMSKCTMCIDRLEQGQQPICVVSCPMRALDFGPIEELRAKYGTLAQIEDMPDPSIAKPAVVFKPATPRKQVVPYDEHHALELLKDRGELPPLYTSEETVTEMPEGLVSRERLHMKPADTSEVMRYTRNDQG